VKRFSSILFCSLFLFFGPGSAAAQELVVSAAASLTNAFNALKTEFENTRPEVRIVPNYAATGSLFRQIEQGAPVDVFASADTKWMDAAIQAGLVLKQESVIFAHNSIVLAVPVSNQAAIKEVRDLSEARVRRIAIGSPATVPAGNYAMLALQELELWEVLQPKYIYAENVRQVLDYLLRGEVEAGFLFATDAWQADKRVSVVATLSLKEPVIYPIAPLARSSQPELSHDFIQFIVSAKGQEILGQFGFKKPE
jgi:molybdate transport system substrate-binding protein